MGADEAAIEAFEATNRALSRIGPVDDVEAVPFEPLQDRRNDVAVAACHRAVGQCLEKCEGGVGVDPLSQGIDAFNGE